MTRPAHLFRADDGALYDTRDPDWSRKTPLRAVYGNASPNMTAMTPLRALQSVKALLRFGPYAWPGGYPLYFITHDGAALSYEAVRQQWRQVVADHLDGYSSGWLIAAAAMNEEDADLWCDHTGARIPSAYAEDDADAV